MDSVTEKILSKNNIKPAKDGRCGFFVKRKQRFCKMLPAKGDNYCAEHLCEDKEKNGTDEKKRVPCPVDPKHTVFVDRLAKHIKKCNATIKTQVPYYKQYANSGIKDYVYTDEEKLPLSSVDANDLQALINKLKSIYSQLNQCISQKTSLHSVLDEERHIPHYGPTVLKHLTQQASLIQIMEDAKILCPDTTYIEFGAGRGKLSHWVQRAAKNETNTRFILVDRSNNRNKVDCYHKGDSQGPSFERLFVDIEHLDLSEVASILQSDNNIVGIGKHLCGGATDLSYRCLMEADMSSRTCASDSPTESSPKRPRQSNLLDKVNSCLFATCCYHRCTWPSYVGRDFFERYGVTPLQFHRLCKMAAWATCAFHKRNDDSNEREETAEEPSTNMSEPEAKHKKLGLTSEEQEEIGRMCKRLIDEGRMEYLRSKGFQVELLQYVDSSVTLENIAILVKRQP